MKYQLMIIIYSMFFKAQFKALEPTLIKINETHIQAIINNVKKLKNFCGIFILLHLIYTSIKFVG